jgi:hypothetical protein
MVESCGSSASLPSDWSIAPTTVIDSAGISTNALRTSNYADTATAGGGAVAWSYGQYYPYKQYVTAGGGLYRLYLGYSNMSLSTPTGTGLSNDGNNYWRYVGPSTVGVATAGAKLDNSPSGTTFKVASSGFAIGESTLDQQWFFKTKTFTTVFGYINGTGWRGSNNSQIVSTDVGIYTNGINYIQIKIPRALVGPEYIIDSTIFTTIPLGSNAVRTYRWVPAGGSDFDSAYRTFYLELIDSAGASVSVPSNPGAIPYTTGVQIVCFSSSAYD